MMNLLESQHLQRNLDNLAAAIEVNPDPSYKEKFMEEYHSITPDDRFPDKKKERQTLLYCWIVLGWRPSGPSVECVVGPVTIES